MGNKRFFMIAMVLLVLGGLNWGYAAFYGKDFVSKVAGKKAWIVYGLVGLAALTVGFARDTYLPFLGPTVMPCSLLRDQTPEGANTSISIQTRPGAKVLYWASEPATEPLSEIKDWRQAYLAFGNAGVVTADAQGMATLSVRKPQAYTVPMKGRLEAHIHYRICGDGGMLGRVETTYVPSKEHFMKEVNNNAEMYKVNFYGNYIVDREPIDEPVGEKYLMKKKKDYIYTVKPISTKKPDYLASNSPESNDLAETAILTPKSTVSNVNNNLLTPDFGAPPPVPEGFESENQKEIDSIEKIQADTMARIHQMDANGLDESPQPAGAPYQTAFNIQTQ